MRILVDQNLAYAVATSLIEAGHNVLHTIDLDLQTAPDTELLELCRTEKRAFLTGDIRLTKYLVEPKAKSPSVIIIRGYKRDIDALPDILAILPAVENINSGGDDAIFSVQKDKLARIRILPLDPVVDDLG